MVMTMLFRHHSLLSWKMCKLMINSLLIMKKEMRNLLHMNMMGQNIVMSKQCRFQMDFLHRISSH